MEKSPTQRILLAEDEQEIRAEIVQRIQAAFPEARITEASNGTEAIQKMALQKFSILITDSEMPRRDGMGVLAAMANMLDSNLKPDHVIMIASGPAPESYPKNIGPVAFFPKPLDFESFLKHLNGLFEDESSQSKSSAQKIDVEFIGPFIEATLHILSVTAGVEAKKERVALRTVGQISGDISAMIAMNSQKYLGSMAISFPAETYLAIVSGMLGETYTTITPEIQDAAAEICNQIFGTAKTALNQRGHTIQPAIPSVITGPGHTIGHTAQGPCLTVQFQSSAGPFTIETVTQAITPTN